MFKSEKTKQAERALQMARDAMKALDQLEAKDFAKLDAKVCILVSQKGTAEGTLVGSCKASTQVSFVRGLVKWTTENLRNQLGL